VLVNVLPSTETAKKEKRFAVIVVSHDNAHASWFRMSFDNWPHLVYYCTSFQEALAIMDAVLPDILILNIDTPGFSYHDFLVLLQRRFPQTIRMIFSSEKDKLTLMKHVSDGVAHRCFCYPWEENNVGEILTNDLQMRSEVRVRKCLKFLALGGGIPTLPDVVHELEETLQNPKYQLDDIVAIIERDPAIAARLLKVVNSSLFPKRCEIDTLHRALNFLGISQARKIILFICATQHFQYPKRQHSHVLKIIGNSWLCSRLAGMIAAHIAPGQERTAATAALLHDIGKLILCSRLGSNFHPIATHDFTVGHSTVDIEKKKLGICHLELGSTLMLLWNLPLTIVEAIAQHALPLSELEGISKIVAIADRCLQETLSQGKIKTDVHTLNTEYPVDEWRDMAQKIINIR